MSQQMQPTGRAPFDTIRHSDEAGEYWLARDLMPMLEYSSWQRFEEVIQRAIEDCAKSGRAIQEHFNLFVKKTPGRPQNDYRLTRYACRLIVMAARTSGQTAALARTYFSDQVDKGDLPPAMTATELALNALASTVSRELHVTNDSHGFTAVSKDVRLAGEIVGRTRQDIERATGKPVVSSRNMLNEPDGGIWAQLPPSDDDAGE